MKTIAIFGSVGLISPSFSLRLKVVDGSEGWEVQLINRKSLRSLTSQMLDVLMSQEGRQEAGSVRVDELSERYLQLHGAPLNPCEYGFLSLSELLKSMPYLVEVRRSWVAASLEILWKKPSFAVVHFLLPLAVVPRAR